MNACIGGFYEERTMRRMYGAMVETAVRIAMRALAVAGSLGWPELRRLLVAIPNRNEDLTFH